jgi:hypothetical protein
MVFRVDNLACGTDNSVGSQKADDLFSRSISEAEVAPVNPADRSLLRTPFAHEKRVPIDPAFLQLRIFGGNADGYSGRSEINVENVGSGGTGERVAFRKLVVGNTGGDSL